MKIILLPGLDGTGLLFKPILELLPKHLDVISVSYPTNQKFDYDHLVQLVIKQLPDEDFIIIAESFSGTIAYKIGLQKSPHLKKIIFVTSFLNNPKPKLLKFSRLLPRYLILKLPIPNLFIRRFLLGKHIDNSVIRIFKHAISQVATNVIVFRLNLISALKKPENQCGYPCHLYTSMQ